MLFSDFLFRIIFGTSIDKRSAFCNIHRVKERLCVAILRAPGSAGMSAKIKRCTRVFPNSSIRQLQLPSENKIFYQKEEK